MPSVPIYIRQEDWGRWQALENKAEFIHQALNPDKVQVANLNELKATPMSKVSLPAKSKIIKAAQDDWQGPNFKK